MKNLIEQLKAKPILFQTEMVKAIREGRKTETRRIVKPEPHCFINYSEQYKNWPATEDDNGRTHGIFKYTYGFLWVCEMHYRYGKWVKDGFTKAGKQKWRFVPDKQFNNVRYYDNPPEKIQKNSDRVTGWYKRSSLFMPKEACRLILKIESIGIERVQDIDEESAKKEGVKFKIIAPDQDGRSYKSYEYGFKDKWIEINGLDSWVLNPWCWVIKFSVHKLPIK